MTYLKPTKSPRRQLFDWTLILTYLNSTALFVCSLIPDTAGRSRPVRSLISCRRITHIRRVLSPCRKRQMNRVDVTIRYHPGQDLAQIHCYGIRRLPSRLPSSLSDSSLGALWYSLKYPLFKHVWSQNHLVCLIPKALAVAVQLCLMNPDTGRYRTRGTDGSDHVPGIWRGRKLRFRIV